jgi:hypothetical protein
MAFTPDPDTIRRKLRAAQMAAASAVNNGAPVDEVREAIEAGIAEALDLQARSRTQHAA